MFHMLVPKPNLRFASGTSKNNTESNSHSPSIDSQFLERNQITLNKAK